MEICARNFYYRIKINLKRFNKSNEDKFNDCQVDIGGAEERCIWTYCQKELLYIKYHLVVEKERYKTAVDSVLDNILSNCQSLYITNFKYWTRVKSLVWQIYLGGFEKKIYTIFVQ